MLLCDYAYVINNFNDIQYAPASPKPSCAKHTIKRPLSYGKDWLFIFPSQETPKLSEDALSKERGKDWL